MGATNATVRGRGGRRRVLVIFTLFLALLVVQGIYSFRVSPEPYPVIRMPGFAGAASSEGTRPVTFVRGVVDFADGTSVEINPADIMEPMRFSTARPTLDHVFGPSSVKEWSPEVREWMRERVIEVTGRVDASVIRLCWQRALVHVEDASVTDRAACQWTDVAL